MTSRNYVIQEHFLPSFLPYLLTPWSKVLLERATVISQSRISSYFIEPESSLSRLQHPATCHSSEPDQPSLFLPFHFLKIHLIIFLPSMPGSFNCFPSSMFPHQNFVCTSPIYVVHVPPFSFFSILSLD